MEQDHSWVSATLKTRFTQFQQDSIEHFAVRIRQFRAEQLRQLLSDPTTVTLEIFNQEVWPPDSSTGLAMVFHPAEFAIYNAPSQIAMHMLGFSIKHPS